LADKKREINKKSCIKKSREVGKRRIKNKTPSTYKASDLAERAL
jgi:hypothetical protein